MGTHTNKDLEQGLSKTTVERGKVVDGRAAVCVCVFGGGAGAAAFGRGCTCKMCEEQVAIVLSELTSARDQADFMRHGACTCGCVCVAVCICVCDDAARLSTVS